MDTKEKAAEIRRRLKTSGYTSRKVSVRFGRLTISSEITVTIKDLSVNPNKVREIANAFERIDRCERTGEILGGGNTYVEVVWDREVLATMAQPLQQQLESSTLRDVVDFHGWKVFRDVEDGYFRAIGPNNGDRDVYCWGAAFCAQQVAERVLASRPCNEPGGKIFCFLP